LANLLSASLGVQRVATLHEDDYYIDQSHNPDFRPESFNFDDITARDHSLLTNDLVKLKAGKMVSVPQYDFIRHARKPIHKDVFPADFIIAEGSQIFYPEPLRNLFDYRIFIDVPDDIRLIRRIKRDLSERGRSLDSILHQYLVTVRPMYYRYTFSTRHFADVVLREGIELPELPGTIPPFDPKIEDVVASILTSIS
jgi:uridine kinase